MSIFAPAKVKLFSSHQNTTHMATCPNDEMFLSLNNRLIPFHKNFLSDCKKIEGMDNSNRIVVLDGFGLNEDALRKVVSCLFGLALQYQRSSQVIKIMEIIELMGIEKMKDYFLKDFETCFHHYGVFVLFEISLKHKILSLLKKCIKDLIADKFQQFHIQRFDLMNCDQNTFIQLIQHHNKLKSSGITKGLKNKIVQSFVQEYNRLNSTFLNPESTPVQTSFYSEFQDIDMQELTKPIVRISAHKRQSTWTHSEGQQKRKNLQKENLNKGNINRYRKASSAGLQEIARDWNIEVQIEALIEKNKQTIEESHKMMKQIKKAHSQLENEEQENQIEGMVAKLKLMKDASDVQKKRIQRIQLMVKQIR